MTTSQFKNWMPEIMYEEGEASEGLTSNIPFIPVPENEKMPMFLFIFESKETGEYEPGPEGEELPVTEMELYQYANMNYLKTRLDTVTFDAVRAALGLETVSSAATKGQALTQRIRDNLGNNLES